MKRVVKLTEAQLESIVRRVIQEQQVPAESQGLWKDDEGITYKLPCVNSNDAWGKFVNFGGGSYATATKLLRDLGLTVKNLQYNPLDVNIDWSKVNDLKDPKAAAAGFVITAFQNGLKQFAQWNPKPEIVKNLKIKDYTGKDYTAQILQVMPNYFDVLSKVADTQKKSMGC
jgi:hypothetical protein